MCYMCYIDLNSDSHTCTLHSLLYKLEIKLTGVRGETLSILLSTANIKDVLILNFC